MSQRCLALAVRNAIRATLNLGVSPLVCDVMFDGQPNPACGEWFYAVHAGDWQGTSGDADLEEIIGVNVTVTRRLGAVPKDRWGPEVWAAASNGLDVQLRQIVAVIHHSYSVMNAANEIIEGPTTTTQWGFAEPLRFLNGGKPEPKYQDWFSADEIVSGKHANAGIAQTLVFGKAKRLQDLTIMG